MQYKLNQLLQIGMDIHNLWNPSHDCSLNSEMKMLLDSTKAIQEVTIYFRQLI
jgi:hypothetical protein